MPICPSSSAVTLAQVDHVPWPVGLGIAFLAGLAFVVLTLTGARGIVVRMVPSQIKLGLGASIGLFIAMVGCRDAGMVAINVKSNALALGDFSQPGVVAALIGLAVAVALQARKLPGALLAGILAATLVGIPFGLTHLPATAVAAPAPLWPVAFALDVPGAVTLAAMPYLFAFFVAEFFSTLGTTLAVGAKAGLTDADGNLPRIERPFLVDALTATLGPLVGVPTGTALVESAAGVQAGGRSGLTAIAAAACFAVTLALTPLAMAIPKQATASALILTGISMLASIRHLQGDEPGDVLPAMAMILVTLISNSFGTGIAAGILAHVAVQIVAGRVRQLPIGLILLAIPLGFFFYGAATHH